MTLKPILLALGLILAGGLSHAENQLSTLRPDATIDEEAPAEPIPDVVNSDVRQVRNYPDQPPLIPHKIDNYTVTMKYNKCMDCHAWNRYKETGATKVSMTHFKTRDGNEMSNISPRRYFCMQCHVPQADAKPLVANKFKPAEGIR